MTLVSPHSCVGVVAALPAEGGCLTGRRVTAGRSLRVNDRVLLHVSGIGATRARAAAQQLLQRGASHLLSWGVAGGLDSGLSPGTIVMPARIVGSHDLLTVDSDWRYRLWTAINAAIDICDGDIANVPAVLSLGEQKVRLNQATGAVAADMESFAIAQIARDAGVPFIAVRAIADTAGQRLPASALSALRPDGSLRTLHVAARIFRHPGEVGELMRLERHMRQACKALRTVARIAPDFACPVPAEPEK